MGFLLKNLGILQKNVHRYITLKIQTSSYVFTKTKNPWVEIKQDYEKLMYGEFKSSFRLSCIIILR